MAYGQTALPIPANTGLAPLDTSFGISKGNTTKKDPLKDPMGKPRNNLTQEQRDYKDKWETGLTQLEGQAKTLNDLIRSLSGKRSLTSEEQSSLAAAQSNLERLNKNLDSYKQQMTRGFQEYLGIDLGATTGDGLKERMQQQWDLKNQAVEDQAADSTRAYQRTLADAMASPNTGVTSIPGDLVSGSNQTGQTSAMFPTLGVSVAAPQQAWNQYVQQQQQTQAASSTATKVNQYMLGAARNNKNQGVVNRLTEAQALLDQNNPQALPNQYRPSVQPTTQNQASLNYGGKSSFLDLMKPFSKYRYKPGV